MSSGLLYRLHSWLWNYWAHLTYITTNTITNRMTYGEKMPFLDFVFFRLFPEFRSNECCITVKTIHRTLTFWVLFVNLRLFTPLDVSYQKYHYQQNGIFLNFGIFCRIRITRVERDPYFRSLEERAFYGSQNYTSIVNAASIN